MCCPACAPWKAAGPMEVTTGGVNVTMKVTVYNTAPGFNGCATPPNMGHTQVVWV